MSFFRSIRTSITQRGKSASRDTTPVRCNSNTSRPASVISSIATTTTTRRDSTGSRADSLLNRGDTFILDEEQQQQQQSRNGGGGSSSNQSNNSTLEKKSKKSKVFSKFSTFTKRKKSTSTTPTKELASSFEHHPSDTATNTYYKWKTDGNDRLLDYDAQADPFNFLYEQHSSLKSMANGNCNNHHAAENNQMKVGRTNSVSSNSSFDSSTFRKSKTPKTAAAATTTTHTKGTHMEQLKTLAELHDDEAEVEDPETAEADKYKTVTINSFRKSFRDKLLQQQTQTPHNPAWFVEVEPGKDAKKAHNFDTKENRTDYLIFENDNYRPTSRSPLRERASRATTARTSLSPVKRNETFRVEQPNNRWQRPTSASPATAAAPTPTTATKSSSAAIRIEFKNSITPNMPGRVVPVGVAKPMPTTEYYAQRLLAANAASNGIAAQPATSRNWYNTRQTTTRMQSPTRSVVSSNASTRGSGRYQTLVQIGNAAQDNKIVTRGRAPTRVQLMHGAMPGGGAMHMESIPFETKRATKYAYNTPTTTTATSTTLLKSNGYDNVQLREATGNRPKLSKTATYFGDHQPLQHYQTQRNYINGVGVGNATAGGGGVGGTPVTVRAPKSPFGQSRLNNGGGGGGVGSIYLGGSRREQYYPATTTAAATTIASAQRVAAALPSMQRRTRSPIKIPWR